MRSMATTLLGKNLKTLRQLKHINQEKLAKAVGVTRTRIASYETQNIEPKLVLLAKIAAYFSISIDVLVTVPVTRDNYDSLKTRYQSGTQPKVSGPLPLVQLPKLTSGVLLLLSAVTVRLRRHSKEYWHFMPCNSRMLPLT